MANAISSQMAAGLVNLMATKEELAATQTRLATGTKVASAADDIAVYFKARAYREQADSLTAANVGIAQATDNLGVVDKALVNIQDNLKGAMQLMKDARAKAVTTTKAAITVGDQKYGYVAPVAASAGPPAVTEVKEVKGDIVKAAPAGTAAATDADSSAYFQIGDVFALTMADAASGTKTTRFFRAADPTADLPTAARDGSSTAQAMNFRDLASLGDAIQKAFGTDSIDVSLTDQNPTNPATRKFSLGFTLTNTSQSLSAWQAIDAAVNTGAVNPAGGPNPGAATRDPGSPFDFGVLFGKQQNLLNGLYQTAGVINSETYTFVDNGATRSVTGARTWGALGGKAADAEVALQGRRDAANFFRQTLYGVSNMVKDARMPGFGNVLKGEKIEVALNDTGDVTQTIQLTKAADPLSLGFVGFTADANGRVNTTDTLNDFNTDAAIDSSIDQVNTALSNLKLMQTTLAASQTAMSSRLDFNKAMVTKLSSGANAMTAADLTAEAAKAASLQTQQDLALTALATTKQSDQGLIQILR